MKIYEKPMAIVNRFEVADVIAASEISATATKEIMGSAAESFDDTTTQGVVFQW